MEDTSIKSMVRKISPRQFTGFTTGLCKKGEDVGTGSSPTPVPGREVARALHILKRRLQTNPGNLGEPLYRLAALRLQIRTVVIGPLAVDFGVHEVHPLVFIKGVTLLSKP
jgi:hypothetical protein